MYCQRCGTQLSEGEKYCPNCGKPVAHNHNNVSSYTKMDDRQILLLQEKEKRKKIWIGIIIVGIIFFIGLLSNEENDNKTSSGSSINSSESSDYIQVNSIIKADKTWNDLSRSEQLEIAAKILNFIIKTYGDGSYSKSITIYNIINNDYNITFFCEGIAYAAIFGRDTSFRYSATITRQ